MFLAFTSSPWNLELLNAEGEYELDQKQGPGRFGGVTGFFSYFHSSFW